MKKIILLLTICLLFLAGISYAQIGYDGKRVTPRSPVGDIMHYPAAGFAISTGYAWDTTIPKGTMTAGKYCTYAVETGISCTSEGGSSEITMQEYNEVTNDTTLTAAKVSRTLITNYGMGNGAVTLTLPAAAEGYTFIAMIAAKVAYDWKIQRGGSDTITWSSGGTDTTGKTYFKANDQNVGSRVSCITYKSGSSSYTWLCGSVTGTWTTD